MPKVVMADALLDIKDSLPQHNSINIVNDSKLRKTSKFYFVMNLNVN